jgi:hypothetical protein
VHTLRPTDAGAAEITQFAQLLHGHKPETYSVFFSQCAKGRPAGKPAGGPIGAAT